MLTSFSDIGCSWKESEVEIFWLWLKTERRLFQDSARYFKKEIFGVLVNCPRKTIHTNSPEAIHTGLSLAPKLIILPGNKLIPIYAPYLFQKNIAA